MNPLRTRLYSTLYEVLESTRDASRKELKSNYYRLSKLHHPDITGSDNQKIVELNHAWSVLQAEQSRREYDRSIANPVQQHFTGHGRSYASRRTTTTTKRWSPPPPPFQGRRPDPIFDHRTHHSSHYSNCNINMHDIKRMERDLRSQYFREKYEHNRLQAKLYTWTTLIGLSVFLYASGWIQLLYL